MGDKTAISWTRYTWNPWRGCERVSPGCAHCYMFTAQRRSGPGFRPMPHEWARELLAKARAADAAFFFKQSAAIRTEMGTTIDGLEYKEYPRARGTLNDKG